VIHSSFHDDARPKPAAVTTLIALLRGSVLGGPQATRTMFARDARRERELGAALALEDVEGRITANRMPLG
jgi:hypothetical protein